MAATGIPRGPIDMAAHLHLPDDVDDRATRAAVVIAPRRAAA
jgi:hypothetical protein